MSTGRGRDGQGACRPVVHGWKPGPKRSTSTRSPARAPPTHPPAHQPPAGGDADEAAPSAQRVPGLYMYGGVGVGKTMLMDLLVKAAPPQFKVGARAGVGERGAGGWEGAVAMSAPGQQPSERPQASPRKLPTPCLTHPLCALQLQRLHFHDFMLEVHTVGSLGGWLGRGGMEGRRRRGEGRARHAARPPPPHTPRTTMHSACATLPTSPTR